MKSLLNCKNGGNFMPTHIAVHYHQILEVMRLKTRLKTHYLHYLMVMNCNMCRHKVPAVFAVKNDFILTSEPPPLFLRNPFSLAHLCLSYHVHDLLLQILVHNSIFFKVRFGLDFFRLIHHSVELF